MDLSWLMGESLGMAGAMVKLATDTVGGMVKVATDTVGAGLDAMEQVARGATTLTLKTSDGIVNTTCQATIGAATAILDTGGTIVNTGVQAVIGLATVGDALVNAAGNTAQQVFRLDFGQAVQQALTGGGNVIAVTGRATGNTIAQAVNVPLTAIDSTANAIVNTTAQAAIGALKVTGTSTWVIFKTTSEALRVPLTAIGGAASVIVDIIQPIVTQMSILFDDVAGEFGDRILNHCCVSPDQYYQTSVGLLAAVGDIVNPLGEWARNHADNIIQSPDVDNVLTEIRDTAAKIGDEVLAPITKEVIDVTKPVTEPFLRFLAMPLSIVLVSRAVSLLESIGPAVNDLPDSFRSFYKNVVRMITLLIDNPVFSAASRELYSYVLSEIARRLYDTKEQTIKFFKLGIDPQYDQMGIPNNTESVFFPDALQDGPQTAQFDFGNEGDVKLALSCAFFATFSYCDKGQIVKAQSRGMLPNCDVIGVQNIITASESYLFRGRSDHRQWVVLAIRGTEPEILRDWLTSADLTLVPFDQVRAAEIRSDYAQAALNLLNSNRANRELGGFSSLVDFLCGQDNTKVYITGHSLGGGIATIISAMLCARGSKPTATITFGSPAIGNQDFVNWYNESYNLDATAVSWRFVNGDEFAPMSPPIPFPDINLENQYHHVNQFISVDHTGLALDVPGCRNRLNQLQRQHQLSKILNDHNLILTIESLKADLP